MQILSIISGSIPVNTYMKFRGVKYAEVSYANTNILDAYVRNCAKNNNYTSILALFLITITIVLRLITIAVIEKKLLNYTFRS